MLTIKQLEYIMENTTDQKSIKLLQDELFKKKYPKGAKIVTALNQLDKMYNVKEKRIIKNDKIK